ncbi:glutamate synthase large subunit [Pontibacillus sp. HMF3514]|uniref:glutamate synthase large subunit n=1 Tax=Pontibacillus sp. HMF3514 TaxID=2692425 RepID=UPI00131F61DD|nr:glutamate synthase large subunit [Pontibacillus sp. HMF3514]QHE52747.1 glutamate synthase large subunit [Pontibacillus sp. HMF3514]
MRYNQIPNSQGLYHPELEHDACGIGLYASIKGDASHEIVQQGLQMLCQLDHRGGQGSDPFTGDGAGLLVQIPDDFFQKVCTDINLPSNGQYGVGMIFFSDDEERKREEQRINEVIEQEGQKVLGWRSVPVNVGKIGIAAQKSCPIIRQVFVGASGGLEEELSFERKLYVIRKQVEYWGEQEDRQFYFASFSSKTIVYKGLLLPEQVDGFYEDLRDEDFVSAFSLVHSRFSTNTFPSWERAHPNRYLIHNGEINTLRGNINWMRAREREMVSDAFGDDFKKLLPILDQSGSDSSVLDNAFEFFVLAGRSPAHAAMMLIPEPWSQNENMCPEKRAFYEYHSTLMEPWDGPTSITFTDGKQIGAILDRNGLRPARYYVTHDDKIIYSSEAGVIDVEEENVAYKNRLSPGKMLLIDLEQGRIISDDEVKSEVSQAHPYREWLDDNLIRLEEESALESHSVSDVFTRQRAFGYTDEDIHKYLVPMITEGKDPVGAMGNDSPLAVLSDRPQSLFNYFKQLFAQVTNPPIDSIREKLVTSTVTYLGAEGDILHPGEDNCHRLRIDTPVLSEGQFLQIESDQYPEFKSRIIDALFTNDLEAELDEICREAEEAIDDGVNILILSDRHMTAEKVAVPTLLATSALHQHLVRERKRTEVSIVVESGETREVHHYASLIGYGADAIYPYLAYETFDQVAEEGSLELSAEEAVQKYRKNVTTGIVKVMSKMGISTVQSYRGAQIFEAVGIGQSVIDRYFTGTVSQLDGIGLNAIAKEAKDRHDQAHQDTINQTLESGSDFQWRKNGEFHAFNPTTIHKLQWACRRNDYELFKEYSEAANEERMSFLRNLFSFKKDSPSIPLEEVESADSIVKRFKTGAMSYGSLSQEAHEALAIAMNRIGGKSNSGEGGEDPSRFELDENGDLRRSAIKQIASGRFGVNSHYLVNSDELQIKVAQGAKPGEGGQLPGKKVYPWIGKVRGSTTGVGLISPPPHHDIYSIEDLAQLIYDLKNSNRDARISVKLVAKSGIGTIAAGVAKGAADVIAVSGYDGGTGASPKTSIKHAGLPWELGLSETHQTLMLNGLRDRVTLETDGKLMTGKDVVMASLLGAEEYGFATAPLVVLGCVMMRVCHKDTCPVGVATQSPELRKKFSGQAEHIVNYMYFVAEEMREIMAELGFRTVKEMVGRTDVLSVSERAKNHPKARTLDLSKLIYQPEGERTCIKEQNHRIEESLDIKELLPAVSTSIATGKPMTAEFSIRNIYRTVGTIVGSEISKRYGEEGLPTDTISLRFTGSAGQSFGAFIPRGLSLSLTGDANDYVGKGLSGGKISIAKHQDVPKSNSDVIIGNVAFYGATSGEAYINGQAGERFAVRNSGANVVVEGIGDHGCEYMTGGRVAVLGDVGKNFAAGMSGGIAYVLSEDRETFKHLCNQEMIDFEDMSDLEEITELQQMIHAHYTHTGSLKAAHLLNHWNESVRKFVKVIPHDYKLMLQQIEEKRASGLSEKEASLSAFEEKFSEKKKTPNTPPLVVGK